MNVKVKGGEKRHEDVLTMKCHNCNTQWDEYYSVPMVFSAFIQRLKLKCPQCGANSKKIYILDEEKE